MNGLAAGSGADATTLPLSHGPLPADDVVSGAPTTAVHELGELGGVGIGVWEMTPGTATDTEADEVFVVLSGRARIDFTSPALPPLEVGPGTVVRLAAGMRTTWTVTETLRKIYLTPAS